MDKFFSVIQLAENHWPALKGRLHYTYATPKQGTTTYKWGVRHKEVYVKKVIIHVKENMSLVDFSEVLAHEIGLLLDKDRQIIAFELHTLAARI